MSQKKWIKQQKLRELSVTELSDRLAELKAQIFANRFQRSTGKLENFRLMPQTRHRLAAVLTILHEKQSAAEGKK
jgi:large subunit ribosomal protein L29